MKDLEAYLDQLKRLPFVRGVELKAARGAFSHEADAELVLHTPDGSTPFLVEHKRTHLSNEAGERLLHLRKAVPNLLLFAPLVGRLLSERFGQHGLNFVDLAGNCHVSIGDRYFAHVEGKRGDIKPPAERGLRAQSYRVLFALLAAPGLSSSTARALAQASGGVSPQTAIDTRAKFVDRGFLVNTARGPVWAPQGWKSAVDVFIEGFITTLASQLLIGRFQASERDPVALESDLQNRLEATTGLEWRWGGGAASARLTRYFRGDQTVVYVGDAKNGLAKSGLAKQLRLRPDAAGRVRLYMAPGPLAFQSPVRDCVHPLLAYADLLAEGDERARDGAAEIYDRYLHGPPRS